MIPLPQILAELIMALGGALLVGSIVALVRSRTEPGAPVHARGRVVLNAFIGLVVFVWGLASFVTRMGGKA